MYCPYTSRYGCDPLEHGQPMEAILLQKFILSLPGTINCQLSIDCDSNDLRFVRVLGLPYGWNISLFHHNHKD